MPQEVKRTITLHGTDECVRLFGEKDNTLRLLKESFNVGLVARGNEVVLSGSPQVVAQVIQVIDGLRARLQEGFEGLLTVPIVKDAIVRQKGENRPVRESRHGRGHPSGALRPSSTVSEQSRGNPSADSGPSGNVILVSSRKKPIAPRTRHQIQYVEAIQRLDVVFGIGPAGTGKTYLAVAMAIACLRNSDIARLILTRPAVEAGEKLGFLPGDMQDKVDPYLRPLYDALYDMVEYEKLQRLFQQRVVEVAPLAYMRGRTLSNAFIILDEAQNTTPEQMKMFLTRMGVGSRMVVTGDITQMDIPPGKTSGLIHVMKVLKDVQGIEFVKFDSSDVVRHILVQSIIEAYEKEYDDSRG